MRAIVVDRPGPPDVMTIGERPDPEAFATDVVIEVTAAGVNRADVNQRQGHYPPPVGASDIIGMEVSGTVVEVGKAVGAGTSGLSVGDRVCALLPGGGYAERVAVDAGLVLPVPPAIDLVEAAGLPEVVATVWSNVFQNAGLQPGETLLVHGGSSGIGTMAIQVATALGSKVVATAGSDDKVAFCEELGAVGVNYREHDFVDAVAKATDGRGADVVLDMVGGSYLARNVEALAMGGRIMVIANQSGDASTFQLGALMARRGRVWGTTLRSRPLAEKVAVMAGVRETIWPLLADGSVRPVVDTVFPLEQAADAHRRMEGSTHIGKLLLRVR